MIPSPMGKASPATGDLLTPPVSAYRTKSLPILQYPLRPGFLSGQNVVLTQIAEAPTELQPGGISARISASRLPQATTGTTLWLSSQILALYLTEAFRYPRKRLRAIELGSGVGLTALVLSSLSIDVVATDLPVVVDNVLKKNVRDNRDIVEQMVHQEGRFRFGNWEAHSDTAQMGKIDVKVLDWTVNVEKWRWDVSGNVTPSPAANSTAINGADVDVVSCQTTANAYLQPPFDLIVSSDTLYNESLVPHLLHTMYNLSLISKGTKTKKSGNLYPLILLSMERRDSDVINRSFDLARKMGFVCEKVRKCKLAKLLRKARMLPSSKPPLARCDNEAGSDFEKGTGDPSGMGEWDGIEIWRLRLAP